MQTIVYVRDGIPSLEVEPETGRKYFYQTVLRLTLYIYTKRI